MQFVIYSKKGFNFNHISYSYLSVFFLNIYTNVALTHKSEPTNILYIILQPLDADSALYNPPHSSSLFCALDANPKLN